MLPFSDCNGPSSESTDITWFPNLRQLCIGECPKLSQLPPIPYTFTLEHVQVSDCHMLKLSYWRNKRYLRANGYNGALAFHNLGRVEDMSILDGPHVSLTDLQKLNSLRELAVSGDMFSGELGDNVVLSSVQNLSLSNFHPTERLLSNVFRSLPALSKLEMRDTKEGHRELVVTQFPSSSLLRKLKIYNCDNLVLNAEGGGAFRNLTSLHSLTIFDCDMKFSRWSSAEASEIINFFPASVRVLCISGQQDMRSMALLSNLTSLTGLRLIDCSKLTMEGFTPLIISNLKWLEICGCGSVAAEVLSEAARTKTTVLAGSCQLEHLRVDSIAAVLVAPVCSRLSATLRKLCFSFDETIERFTEEQEKALQLLTTLEELRFPGCSSLQSLPEVLHRLCSLKKLDILRCGKIQSLPKSGLPTSLESLVAIGCNNKLRIKLRELEESHPDLDIH